MNRPLSRNQAAPWPLSFDHEAELRNWLIRVFRDIHRATGAIQPRALPLAPDPLN